MRPQDALATALLLTAAAACQPAGQNSVEEGAGVIRPSAAALNDADLEDLVRRSYQYVAMFNVNNKFALDESSPMTTRGYNRVFANTELADHRFQAIARPNNDTLYAMAMIDVTEEPIVLEIPAFDSTYASLMVTAYDHYVNIPMSSRLGDFGEPTTMLFYSERTPGYDGGPVDGVDRKLEVTGDFVSAVFRIMPHAAEPARMQRNLAAMRAIDVMPLSEFRGGAEDELEYVPWGSPPGVPRSLTLKKDQARFPEFGSDLEIFEDRLLEVMQFVFNHTTFDEDDELDAALLAAYAPLEVEPGRAYDPRAVPALDGAAVRAVAERVAAEAVAKMRDAEYVAANNTKIFQPKGKIALDLQVMMSVVGPIGQPASEAVYQPILTDDGQLMNAMFDYEIVMAAGALPPAKAFWSLTLYDSEGGFFVPNDRFKYSVGQNAGYRLDDDGGIRIVIAANEPPNVPKENWLPVNRGDYELDVQLRQYAPDLERYATWSPPVARRLD